MKAQILATSVEPTEYLAPALADLEPVMTAEEREAAAIKGWVIKGVEPGGEEVFSFRVAADHAPDDISTRIFQPLEIDCRGVTGRGWIRSGQTKGSVDATITFQAVAVTPIEMTAPRVALARVTRVLPTARAPPRPAVRAGSREEEHPVWRQLSTDHGETA